LPPKSRSNRLVRLAEYGVDASFMSLLQRERGIHALRFGAGDFRVMAGRFCAIPATVTSASENDIAV
jgi:hypothetical protein